MNGLSRDVGGETLLLTRRDIESIVSMREAIELVEGAFREKGEGRVQMPPKPYIFFPSYNGDLRIMPAYLERSDISGVKVVNVHPDNPKKHSLPSVMATIILIDPKTGFPLCIAEGSWITAMRTGAAGGVAARYLSREDSETVGIIGAGIQGRTQLLAINEVREISTVKVADILDEARSKYVAEMEDKTGLRMLPVKSTREAAEDVDILVTATPSTKPLVKRSYIADGTHINAIGADAPGKQELDPEIFREAKVVVDDWEQASHSGEIHSAVSKETLSRDAVHAELGDIIVGRKLGRTSNDEITLFDSTGLAIQDVTLAWAVFERAARKGVGSWVKII